MAINEEKVTGRKFRKLVDEAQKLWQRISFWTMACDVEFEDGENLEEKFLALEKRLNGLSFQMKTQSEFDINPPQDKHVITFIDPTEEDE